MEITDQTEIIERAKRYADLSTILRNKANDKGFTVSEAQMSHYCAHIVNLYPIVIDFNKVMDEAISIEDKWPSLMTIKNIIVKYLNE